MVERVAGKPERAVLVVSSAWWSPQSESAFVARSVAGALSRHAAVEVVAPAAPPRTAPITADGLFDVSHEPRTGIDPAFVVAPAGDGAALGLAAGFSSAPLVTLGDAAPDARSVRWSPGVAADRDEISIGLHVPVNPLAAERPHNGLGFTDYLLVLTDRGGGERRADDDAPDLARWLAAAFAAEHLVVVEAGAATVWRCRALRGVVTVDSRTDLWRLMAHARVVVDLGPGPLVARECVEALRFGTPVVVPAGTAAARLADAGGGLPFRDLDELFRNVDCVASPERRAELSTLGRAAADARYGDADAFVRRVGAAMKVLG